MKITPPERELVAYLTRQFWVSAVDCVGSTDRDMGWVQAKLKRLAKLGLVESMPDRRGRVYRLTAEGERWKREEMNARWRPAQDLPRFSSKGWTVRWRGKTGTSVLRDHTSQGDCLGVEFSDGFEWCPVGECEVRHG